LDIYLARQPIFDRKKRLFAYEILYRGDLTNVFPDTIDGEVATSTVLAHFLFNMGLEGITGGKKALINFTEKHLLDRTPLQLPANTCIIEILEDVTASDLVIAACSNLKRSGYTIALDDYTFASSQNALLPYIDIIKIDLKAIELEQAAVQLTSLTRVKQFKYLAEKVEDHDEYLRCVELGFDYFQGYFFSKPELLRQKNLDVSKVTLLSLIAEVNKKDFSFSRVEKMITTDVALSYKLLRYINSAYYSLISKVRSIRHALSYLGEKGARQFICLAIASELSSEKTPELTKLAIIRAQFCRLIALKANCKYDESQLFLLGLFSLLDSMLDMSMPDLLENLPLADELKEALQDRKGPFAPYINAVITYERGDLDQCESCLCDIGLQPNAMVALYYDALKWADLFNE
jgi:EAL and modified HD-GYP domain-containing signal transduction protein